MKNIKIFSTNASNGAVLLAEKIRKLGFKSTKVPFRSKTASVNKTDLVINWGSSEYPSWITRTSTRKVTKLLNHPELVKRAIDKISTFNILSEVGVSIPEYVVNGESIPRNWKETIIRETTTGSGGRGIKLVMQGEEVRMGYPLYVQYIKKSSEYRVHVFDGNIIDVQEKRKRKDFEGKVNPKIRNLESGWVFCREEVAPPIQVLNEAIAAVDALDLDFGAVDLIWNKHYNTAYVLEVNTAPGLEGTTVDNYARAIVQYINNLEEG